MTPSHMGDRVCSYEGHADHVEVVSVVELAEKIRHFQDDKTYSWEEVSASFLCDEIAKALLGGRL